jgi:hypothetical protein
VFPARSVTSDALLPAAGVAGALSLLKWAA